MLTIHDILPALIRFDTTNPPGNEAACIGYIHQLFQQAGIDSQVIARSPQRPNLVARLPGAGQAPPLLLYGHVDVVGTAGQVWQVPPFEGRVQDGYLWGRGTLDMKGPLSLFIAALLQAKAENLRPPGDIIFAALADEEVHSEFGARYLVEQHPGLFQGVRYALGEFGGFNLDMGGVRFYPIMIAEKGGCWMQAVFRGPGGHGAMPVTGGAMGQAGRVMHRLSTRRLPVRITPPVRLMIEALAAALPGVNRLALRGLLSPPLTDPLLKLMGERGALFSPLLRNTVSPTTLQGSDKINVIPAEVRLGLDGRLVPGATPADMAAELHAAVGHALELEIISAEPAPGAPDLALFERLGAILRRLDPLAVPIPYVLSGVTDARHFARLGIQTYGFTPLQLPADFNFIRTVHAADERVPLSALDFGVQAVYQALQIF